MGCMWIWRAPVGVEVRDPRAISSQGKSGLGEGRQTVNAPMPGKVVRLLVSEGDEVEAGAGLVVVEAMKMQNELKAPKAGV
jgi:biotin carboxyl carrier protein